MSKQAIQFLRDTREQHIEQLRELLRIPSVSTDPGRADDCRRAAEWLVAHMTAGGLAAELAETEGHPAVIGQWADAGPSAPTVLLYGHYDVQPPEPLDKWLCDPFAAELRDTDAEGRDAPEGGTIIARGSSDNKGQHMAMLAGVFAHLQTAGRLPVNLKVLIEGEEEIGSKHLGPLLEARRDDLACDMVLLADGDWVRPHTPAIAYSLRGLVYVTIEVAGPSADIHSGLFGGVVTNPANALARLLAGLHDEDGHVTLDGFYDGVEELTEQQRDELADLATDEKQLAGDAGVAGPLGGGEAGRSVDERRWFRPTCDVNGLSSGYQGPGSKTIIPSSAMAKVSFRLVGGQDPVKIRQSLESYLQENCPRGVTVKVSSGAGARPYQADRNHPAFASLAAAIEAASGSAPTWIGGGGTLPVLAEFKETLGVDSLFLGLARSDCHLHGPNEQFDVRDYHIGAETSAHFWTRLAEQMG